MKRILPLFFFFISLSSYSQNCGASFTYNTTGIVVNFYDSSFSNLAPYTSSWDFGDSTFSNQRNPSHTFPTSGRYLTCLTIQDSLSCSDTYCDSITLTVNCQADFNYFIDSNNTVYFNNLSITSPNVKYSWDFGDSSAIDTTANPNHFYASTNTYIISLTLMGGGTTCSFTDTLFVNNCNAQFSTQVDSAGTTSFTNFSTASNSTAYSWDFGDSTSSNQKNPVHSYTSSGGYAVLLSLYDSLSNCNSSYLDSVFITLPSPCEAGFTASVNEDSLYITNTAFNYTSLVYQFGDGDSSFIENPSHVYAQSGTYVVCQTVKDSLSNCSSTFCDTILVTVPPSCVASYAHSTNNDTAFFINLASNYTAVLYQFGDGDSSILENPTHIYTQSAAYNVCQTVFDSTTNCFDTFCDSVSITIPPKCQAGFTVNISGDSVLFTSTASTQNRMIYYFGDGDSSTVENPIHLYEQSGTYEVRQLVFNDTTNCIDSFIDSITVNISKSCVAKYEIAIDTTKKSKLFLINTSTDDNSHRYYWTFGDGKSATGRTPTHTYSEFGAYKICLTITDSLLQCTSTYCDSVGLDSNGNVLKTNGFVLQVIDGVFIGIEEQITLDETILFPNPVIDILSIKVPNSIQHINYELFDLSGKVMLKGITKKLIEQLDISNLTRGIYFIRLIHNDQTIVKKLIKG